MLGLTKELIRIPSVFGEESDIGEFIASYLGKEDVGLQRVKGFPPNIVARKLSHKAAPTIILNGHMDTIGPLSSWKQNPFKPIMKGNMLYGLGASDMKGGLAVLMKAFQNAGNERINLIFVATVDEEGVCTGSHTFVKKQKGDFCLVGEPSRERLALGARGRYVIDISIEGRAGHGARPDEGTNAIENMAMVLPSLKSVKIRKNRLLGSGSMTPLEIHGGEGSLTLPETCRLEVDRHIVKGETKRIILKDFRDVLDKLSLNCEIQVGLAKRMTPFLEPYTTDKRNKYVRKFINVYNQEYHKEPDITYSRSVGDYNVFGAHMPTVVFGPIGRGSHSSNERLDVRSLYRCERLLTRFLNSL